MAKSRFGTVAQLLYADRPPLNFGRVVDDLHFVLARLHGVDLAPDWDCDDVAVFDLPTARISLGWDNKPGKGYAACLTVSVGPLPETAILTDSNAYVEICSRLVERFNAHFPAIAILWHEAEDHLTGDCIDRLIEDLPPLMQLFPFQEPDWMAEVMTHQSPGRATALRVADSPRLRFTKDASRDQYSSPSAMRTAKQNDDSSHQALVDLMTQLAATWASVWAKRRKKDSAPMVGASSKIANDRRSSPRLTNDELSGVREALYKFDFVTSPTGNSTQMRLAIHAMNATLIIVCLPVGAAVTTYSVLRCADLKITARILVLTGLLVPTIQSAIGQNLAGI